MARSRRRSQIKESLGFLLLMAAVAKGHHFFGIRLLLLAAGGLAGMYLLHNVATDFNQITKPIRPMVGAFLMRPLTTLMKASRGRRAVPNFTRGNLRSRSNLKQSVGCFFMMTTVAHCHIFGIRLLLLAAAGLAGLYMLHTLATDFSNITKPFRPTMSLGLFMMRPLNSLLMVSRGRRAVPNFENKEVSNSIESSLSMVVQNDPLGCAQKYICYIAQKPSSKLTDIDKRVLRVVRSSSKMMKGISTDNRKDGSVAEDCFSSFPLCFFTGPQLETIMTMF